MWSARTRGARGWLVVAASCLVAASAWAKPEPTRVPHGGAPSAHETSGGARERANAIRRFANAWVGTTYLWGGETRQGIDCSAYARQMYRQLFDVELPRTTKDQIHLGESIAFDPERLGNGFEPGDLFFYVDATGIPNHVVIYMGDGQFTHSASGRGVVIEGFKALWGRRIVGRRALVPARSGGGYGPIPAAGPAIPFEIPCPPNIRANGAEVRRFLGEPLPPFKDLGRREICEWRALKNELSRRDGPSAAENVKKIDEYVEWLHSIEWLESQLEGGL